MKVSIALKDIDNDENEIEDAFSYCADLLKAKHRELGLYIEEGILHVDTSNISQIADISQKIVEQYGDEVSTTTEDVWEKYKLQSDDDVDECGTHVLIALDAIEQYLENQMREL